MGSMEHHIYHTWILWVLYPMVILLMNQEKTGMWLIELPSGGWKVDYFVYGYGKWPMYS